MIPEKEELQVFSKDDNIFVRNVIRIIKGIVVKPAICALVGKTVSVLRFNKTRLRSTMSPSKFNSLVLLKIHKDPTT